MVEGREGEMVEGRGVEERELMSGGGWKLAV